LSLKRRSGGGAPGSVGPQDVLVLAAVVGLPWFWGGVGLDAYRTAAALIALAAGWALIRRGAAGLGLDRNAAWLLPAFLLGAFAFLQAVPLPRAWVARLSPRAASIQTDAFGPAGLSGDAWLRQIESDARARVPEAPHAAPPVAGPLVVGPAAPSPPRHFTLSLAPSLTMERAFWYAALLLAFLLVQGRTANERRAAIYRATLFVAFGAIALAGIVSHLTAPNRLLWQRDAPPDTRPFGPYVNPSHFGGVMELAVPWLLGYGLATLVHRGAEERGPARRGLALAGAGLGIVAVLLAASKMAVVTIGLASVVLIAIAISRSRGRVRSVLLVGTVAGCVLLSAVAVRGPLRDRVADFVSIHRGELSSNVRGLAWGAGVRMANDFSLTGSGFGAFGEVFPAYLPRGEGDTWAQLHNDYLEVYLAGGVVAAALVAWLAVAFGYRVARVLRVATGHGRLFSALGLVLGLVALTVHESVDFNLQVPANALLFVVIAAMGVSPLSRSIEDP